MNKNEIKRFLKEVKAEAVKQNPTDKPFIRHYLNDTADSICRDLDYLNMREEITEKRMKQLQDFAHDYAADLHP